MFAVALALELVELIVGELHYYLWMKVVLNKVQTGINFIYLFTFLYIYLLCYCLVSLFFIIKLMLHLMILIKIWINNLNSDLNFQSSIIPINIDFYSMGISKAHYLHINYFLSFFLFLLIMELVDSHLDLSQSYMEATIYSESNQLVESRISSSDMDKMQTGNLLVKLLELYRAL